MGSMVGDRVREGVKSQISTVVVFNMIRFSVFFLLYIFCFFYNFEIKLIDNYYLFIYIMLKINIMFYFK